MKKMKRIKYLFLWLTVFILMMQQNAKAQQDTTPPVPVIKLHYFNNNNSVQYLLLESMMKKGKTLTPQKNKTYKLYLDSSTAERLIADMQTDVTGRAKAIIWPKLQLAWNAAALHTFIVKAADEEIISDYSITRAKITIDTATVDSIKNITASVMKWENNKWLPAADVEMKIGIARNGGILTAGDAETYTTDSTGSITVALKKDSMPGDKKGNYIIAAKVEDNDLFGNLLVEKTVPWGTVLKTDDSFFNQRTLWTTRFRTPYWLLLIAYSIFFAVWGTLLYLVLQLVKIKKLGVQV